MIVVFDMVKLHYEARCILEASGLIPTTWGSYTCAEISNKRVSSLFTSIRKAATVAAIEPESLGSATRCLSPRGTMMGRG